MRHTYILVLTYNYPEGVEKTLDSLLLTQDEDITTIVIFNGVNEKDYSSIFKRNDIQMIKLEENLGFFKAYNKAILSIPSDAHFVILNDDVIIKDGRWLTAMYDDMYNQVVPEHQDPRTWNLQIGVVGYRQKALLFTAKGKKENQETDRWVFSCALLNPIAVRMTGLFDERYFGWWGDFEYLCRLHGTGYKVSTVHQQYIFHEKQHTFKTMDAFTDNNKWSLLDAISFYEQCYHRTFEWKETMPFPINQILREVRWFIRKKLEYIRTGISNE